MEAGNGKESYQKATADWLWLRYPLDASARNRRLERRALSQLSKRKELRVLDLGSGAGANMGYYHSLLPASTQWWLLERDKALLMQLPKFIEWLSKKEGDAIPQRFYPVKADFLNPDCPIYSHSFDLVLANAVFDLLSAEQFQRLLQLFRQAWAERSPVFLFTLNLDQGLEFSPADEDTAQWCQSYEGHMHRLQYFGRAMAAYCGGWMEKLFRENGFKVESGPSNWEIAPWQREVLLAKLGFFEKAMAEFIGADARQRYLFQRWLARKRHQACRRELSLFVPHRDFLARIV